MAPEILSAQRTTRLATMPLGLIAVVFVIPTVRGCNESYESPAQHIDSAWSAFWITPVFFGAAVMALLCVRALVRGQVGIGTRRLALAVVAGLGLNSLLVGMTELWFGAAACAALVIAGALIRSGRGTSPWRIWQHLLAAFAVAAVGTAPTWLLCSFFFTSRTSLGPGAYLYLGALAALLAVTAHALVAGRRRSSGDVGGPA